MLPSEMKAKREAQALSCRELAKLLHLSPAAIRSWEAGTRTPHPTSLRKLIRFYQQREGCRCSCHGDSLRSNRRPWTDEENATLKTLVKAGKVPGEIAEYFQAEGNIRTSTAVYRQMNNLGLYSLRATYRLNEVERLLGISAYVSRRLVHRGVLKAERHRNLKHGAFTHWWEVTEEELQRFVDEYTGVYVYPEKIRDPDLRQRAWISLRLQQRRDHASLPPPTLRQSAGSVDVRVVSAAHAGPQNPSNPGLLRSDA